MFTNFETPKTFRTFAVESYIIIVLENSSEHKWPYYGGCMDAANHTGYVRRIRECEHILYVVHGKLKHIWQIAFLIY